MAWEKLPPLTEAGLRSGCLCCGEASVVLHMDDVIAVGFGSAQCTRDGEYVIGEDATNGLYPRVGEAEALALEDPDHDWRIHLFGPLSEFEYQRQDVRRWVLVRRGEGFA